MNKNIVLLIALVLLAIGIFKPAFLVNDSRVPIDTISVVQPKDDAMIEACKELSDILSKGSSVEAIRLASLYSDIANLISLDEKNEVIKNTEEIRQANILSGILLQLNIKGKYAGLADAANKIVVLGIGDDELILDKELRSKAVETFKILAWACKEGSK